MVDVCVVEFFIETFDNTARYLYSRSCDSTNSIRIFVEETDNVAFVLREFYLIYYVDLFISLTVERQR